MASHTTVIRCEDIMPEWLTQLRTDLIEISSREAKKFWPGPSADSEPYFNYRLEHVQQVERDAKRLLSIVGGDEDIVLASVWIHDRFRPQFEGDRHAARAAEWVSQHLAELGFPTAKVSTVEYAVANHSNAPNTIPEEALEARLLWDADKLTKLGALWVVALLCGCPAFPQTHIGYEWIKQQVRKDLEDAETLVGQFYFEQTQEWGRLRFKAQKAFCEAIEQEVSQ